MKPYAVAQQRRWPPGKERWLYKIVEDGLACGMFERTIAANGKLSDWNAQAVLVDKTDDAGLDDEPRITFNYRNVIEDIPSCHLTLASKVHDYLSHPGHGCFMQLDLKHGYWAVALHPDDRHLFAFAMPGIGQLQPTRMPQGTMTAGFSVIELMHIVLGYLPPVPLELRSHSALGSRPLENCGLHIGIDDVTTMLPSDGSDGSEPSLLHATGSSQMPPVFLYMDDIFSAHSSFEDAFVFLWDHLLPRIEWSMLKLLFKKLVLFTSSITALEVEH